MAVTICPITNVKVQGSLTKDNYDEYSIIFNEHFYTIRIETSKWLDRRRPGELANNWRLKGMLFNNEWDIDQQAVLTSGLLSRLLRMGEFPKNFDEKLNYYILKSYQNGGSEYKQFTVNNNNHLEAYAEDKEEYDRIIEGMLSRDLIHFSSDTTEHFKLTEKGIETAKQLEKIKLFREPIRNKLDGANIFTFSMPNDSFYADTLKNSALSFGSTVVNYDKISDDELGSTISNVRNYLYGNDSDYAIFVKSSLSDKNNTFGSILDIAIEAHATPGKKDHPFIYLAYIDDSGYKLRPRLSDYNDFSFDFRIISNRKRLFKSIEKDWTSRSNKTISGNKYHFPVFKLSEDEKKWLEIVYQQLLKNEYLGDILLLAKRMDEFSYDFKPEKIDQLLVRSGSISLLGIWQIHPESDLFEKFDNVIYAIRTIIKDTGKTDTIESSQIQEIHPDLTSQEILQIFELMHHFGNLQRGMGKREDFSSSLSINSTQIFEQYKNYTGLQSFVNDFLEKNGFKQEQDDINPTNEIPGKEGDLYNETSNFEDIHAHKTAFNIRDKNDVAPVMGVLELANDLAEIIKGFPLEKGQMIGVFGKWGRGKTFFLNELLSVLKTTKDPKSIEYIHIEYPAWKYQETPASWAYLYELFAQNYLGEKKGLKKRITYYTRLISLNYERLGLSPFINLALIVLGSIGTTLLIYVNKYVSYLIPAIPSLLAIGIWSIFKKHKEFSTKAIDIVKQYSTHHSFKEKMGIQADIQNELIKLIKVWIPEEQIGKQKIILVVEDIDRCYEEKILQNIDALRVMLEEDDICKRVIIITAIDERILKNAIRIKYRSIINDIHEGEENENNIDALISEYLDKIFISAIKLGELSISEKDAFFNELIKKEIDSDTIHEAQLNDEKTEDNPYNNAFVERDNIENPIFQYNTHIEEDDGIKASKENITSQSEVEQRIKDRIANQNKFEKLSRIEVKLLKRSIKKFSAATPRKMRIYYYRYLLCKNILINRYALKTLNVWQNEKGIETVLAIISKYTELYTPNEISIQKLSLGEFNSEDTIIVENLPVLKKDYYALLEVLELVIAY